MRKLIIGAAALAAGLAAARLGPGLALRGMKKCHEMMSGMSQSSGQACACRQEALQAAGV